MSTTAEQPWHAAFPTPSSDPPRITSEELHQLIGAQPDLSKRDFLVVDVRRTDFEVRGSSSNTLNRCEKLIFHCAQNGFITGAVNLPAHSFYPTVASLIPLLSRCEFLSHPSRTFRRPTIISTRLDRLLPLQLFVAGRSRRSLCWLVPGRAGPGWYQDFQGGHLDRWHQALARAVWGGRCRHDQAVRT